VERATAMSSAAARLIEVVVTGLVVVLVMSLSWVLRAGRERDGVWSARGRSRSSQCPGRAW